MELGSVTFDQHPETDRLSDGQPLGFGDEQASVLHVWQETLAQGILVADIGFNDFHRWYSWNFNTRNTYATIPVF